MTTTIKTDSKSQLPSCLSFNVAKEREGVYKAKCLELSVEVRAANRRSAIRALRSIAKSYIETSRFNPICYWVPVFKDGHFVSIAPLVVSPTEKIPVRASRA